MRANASLALFPMTALLLLAAPSAGAQSAAAAATPGLQPERTVAPPPAEPTADAAVPSGTAEDSERAFGLAWAQLQSALTAEDFVAVDAAGEALRRLKDAYAVESLDTYGIGLVRAAESRMQADDAAGAVQLATAASELAPSLPMAHWALARAYLFADITSPMRPIAPAWKALGTLLTEKRFLLPLVADVGASALLAFVTTTALLVALLFLRSARNVFHDFHHLFPGGHSRWQSVAALTALLLLPVIFRLGLVPILLMLLAAATWYLNLRERIVVVATLSLLGFVPPLTGALVQKTAYAGTRLDDLDALERGGVDAGATVQRVVAAVKAGEAGYPEHLVLGRYFFRRGAYERAVEQLKAASAERVGDALALTQLGNALFAKGDVEGAIKAYEDATERQNDLPAPHFNLALALQRRAASQPDGSAALTRAVEARRTAVVLDRSLSERDDKFDAGDAPNRLLVSPRIDTQALAGGAARLDAPGEHVEAELRNRVFGAAGVPLASLFPLLMALALGSLGLLAPRLRTSLVCVRCGRPACEHCDAGLPSRSTECSQCVNVFVRKGLVSAAEKARKQLEIQRYEFNFQRLTSLVGAVLAGSGHLLRGQAVLGAVQLFLVLCCVALVFLGDGLLRMPYAHGAWPLFAVPAGLLFFVLQALSWRSLHRQPTKG